MPAELLQYLVPSTFDARAVSHSFRGVARPNVNVRLRSLHEDEDEDVFGVNPDDLDSLQRALGWANVVSVLVRPSIWRKDDDLVDHPDEWDDFLNVLQQCTSIVTLDFGCELEGSPTIGLNQIEKLTAVLPQLPNLRNLYLYNHNIEEGMEELCNVLPQCTSLSHLDLSGNNLDAEDIEDVMKAMQRCTHIKELIFENNNQCLSDTMAIPASNLSLTRLSLSYNEFEEGQEDTGWLAGVLRHCPSLTSLGLNNTFRYFNTHDMEIVSAGLSSCTRLTALDVGSNYLGHGMQVLSPVLPQLPLLRYLDIGGNSLVENDFQTLNLVLGQCTSLTSLNIEANIPGGEYHNLFAQFVDNRFRSPLKVLNLRNTGLVDHIERLNLILPAFTSLQRLDVSANQLRDDQVIMLDESKSPAQRGDLFINYYDML